MNSLIDIHPEVQKAIDQKQGVVALESTIISHGMPYPQNRDTALHVEQIVRDEGATPATIAIIQGRFKVGLRAEEIEYLSQQGRQIAKASRRDIPYLISQQK